MEITRRVISLGGDLDSFSGGALRRTLETIDGAAVIDLRGVRMLSAAALTELVRVAKRVGPGAVVLVVSSREVREVFKLVQFDRLFRIVSRLEQA